MCTRDEEIKWMSQGFKCVIGADEAGCGCLAGPVTICACYIPPSVTIPGINDSKKISQKRREALYDILTKHPDIKYALVHIDSQTIDQINILQSRFKGFHDAYIQLKQLVPEIDMILLDGNQCPPQFKQHGDIKVETIIGGDGKVTCIGAASIIAKVTRDRMMVEYDKEYPGYGLASHKGYYQKAHIEAIQKLGPTPIHRKTFRGVHQ